MKPISGSDSNQIVPPLSLIFFFTSAKPIPFNSTFIFSVAFPNISKILLRFVLSIPQPLLITQNIVLFSRHGADIEHPFLCLYI